MASVESVIHGFLSESASVLALVDSRIYPDDLPQKGATLPAITYYRVSTTHTNTINGSDAGLAQTRLQIDCFGANRAAANSLAETVRLSGIRGLLGVTNGVNIRGVAIDSGQSHYVENPTDGSHEKRYVTSTDYMISYFEDV